MKFLKISNIERVGINFTKNLLNSIDTLLERIYLSCGRFLNEMFTQ